MQDSPTATATLRCSNWEHRTCHKRMCRARLLSCQVTHMVLNSSSVKASREISHPSARSASTTLQSRYKAPNFLPATKRASLSLNLTWHGRNFLSKSRTSIARIHLITWRRHHGPKIRVKRLKSRFKLSWCARWNLIAKASPRNKSLANS